MMTDAASLFPTHVLILLPGLEARKARTTVMVLPKTQETAVEKMIPNKVCLRKQDTFPGQPIKTNEQRKPKSREKSKVQVMLQLLALTIGLSRWRMKVPITATVTMEKKRATETKTAPKGSS